jgi:capsule polysaccharide export protein KpsE/RkpR
LDGRDAMKITEVTRAVVREHAQKYGAERLAFSESGGNIHQKILDQQDELEERLSELSEDERQNFWRMYVEELNASTNHANSEVAKIEAKNALIDSAVGSSGKVIMWAVFAVVCIVAITKLGR